jgi:hypothetical protein
MNLRQYQPGAEPRWKRRPSDDFARGRLDEGGRRAYDQLLATHDVIGLLGHLSQVFVQAQFLLTRVKREEASGANA